MARKLVLVVHGIGEQEPGETLDALVGGLAGDIPCTVETELRHLRERNRDKEKGADERNIPRYPCHIRRVRHGEDTTIFAEAFWGDISRGAKGVVPGLIDLFKLVMGLGNIVRENAAEIHPQRRAWPRAAANAFVYLLHGPITAFNIAIALATAALFAMQALTGSADFAPSLAVLCAVGVLCGLNVWLADDKRSYLYRIFRDWLGWTALILLACVAATHAIAAFAPAETQAEMARLMGSQCQPSRPFSACLDYWYAAFLSNLISLTWALALGLILATGLREFRRRLTAEEDAVKTLYPQAMAMMMIVWLLLVVVIWVAVSEFARQSIEQFGLTTVNVDIMEKGLLPAINFTFWVVVALFIVSASALVAWADRWWWVRRVPAAEHRSRRIRRLIVHPVILAGLTLAIVILTYGAGETIAFQVQLVTSDGSRSFEDLLADSTTYQYFYAAFIPAVGALVGGYSIFGSTMATGIGIAKDVVVFFVRRPAPGRSAKDPALVHPLRSRIEDRLVDTLIRLIRAETPDETLILAHSQGTMICVEALRGGRLRGRMEAAGVPGQDFDLITMGSPVSHLYGFYFSRSFGLKPDPDRGDVTDGIRSWTNIYRVDDFVGTWIEDLPEGFLTNAHVEAGGHTNYWTDESVLRHLHAAGFSAFAAAKA